MNSFHPRRSIKFHRHAVNLRSCTALLMLNRPTVVLPRALRATRHRKVMSPTWRKSLIKARKMLSPLPQAFRLNKSISMTRCADLRLMKWTAAQRTYISNNTKLPDALDMLDELDELERNSYSEADFERDRNDPDNWIITPEFGGDTAIS